MTEERSLEWYKALFNRVMRDDLRKLQNQRDIYDLLLDMRETFCIEDPAGRKRPRWGSEEARDMALKVSTYAHSVANKVAGNTGSGDFDDMYWKFLLFESPDLLDSFALYIEKNRKPEESFYLPRRKTLKRVVDEIQKLEDDKLDELFIHMPARIGKTQIITLATTWHCARNAEGSNLYVTFKEGLGGAFIDGCTEIWTDPTYCTHDVFPELRIARTDAKNHKIDLGRRKKYASLSGKGLESGLNGEYDAYGWLILDDILEGVQDVMNPDILRRKQTVFNNNVLTRRKESCKIIYNGTIWSLHDLYMNRLSLLQNNPEYKHTRYEVLKIPALDPDTDESNFNYDFGVGFTTAHYRKTRATFEENDDMAGWFAQCQQEPIEREGALFKAEHMNFYNGTLPAEEPLKIVSVCDVALGGSDFLSMPVAYVYEDGSVYIHDVIFDNSEKSITKPRVVNCMIANKVTTGFFEANNGGEGYKDEVDAGLKAKGKKITLVSKFAQQMILSTGGHASKSQMRKEQRIWDNAEDIRKFYYRDIGCQSSEYRKFMTNVYSFTMTGKNKHDDAPDSLAALAVFLKKGSGTSVTRIARSPLR